MSKDGTKSLSYEKVIIPVGLDWIGLDWIEQSLTPIFHFGGSVHSIIPVGHI